MMTIILGIIGFAFLIFRKNISILIFNAQLSFYKSVLGSRLNEVRILMYYRWALVAAGIILISMAFANHFGPIEV